MEDDEEDEVVGDSHIVGLWEKLRSTESDEAEAMVSMKKASLRPISK